VSKSRAQVRNTNYIAMLVYKPKQHSKQHTDLKYVIYNEMTD